ncbi:hypothetical protein NW761_015004 [Fusarium oxysporum]|nr:hypothetical protein NW758_015058 [Fusarium oxysporum]KAJ4070985.1 hypothetical protein NW761_015004 [Fusarium oxysporum]KAJ4256636.1 hypothetical protein NW764_016322 [Fusarium oxysporum]
MSIDDDKRPLDVHDAPIGINDNVEEKKGTAADRADMYRMGKTQETTVRTNTCTLLSWARDITQRNFRFLSIFGFSMILMASWESSLR